MSGAELSKTVEEIYFKKGETVKAETSFCEKTENDIMVIQKDDSTMNVRITDFQDELSSHLDCAITHYDEMEVGDFGIGFVFFF